MLPVENVCGAAATANGVASQMWLMGIGAISGVLMEEELIQVVICKLTWDPSTASLE